jgi:hypothetical protein
MKFLLYLWEFDLWAGVKISSSEVSELRVISPMSSLLSQKPSTLLFLGFPGNSNSPPQFSGWELWKGQSLYQQQLIS